MKKYITLINFTLCSLLISYTTHAQSNPEWCGTEPTQEQIDYLSQTAAERQAFSRDLQSRGTISIPIVNHIVTNDGEGGLSIDDLEEAIELLNNFYALAGIEFFECEPVRYINDSNLYDFNPIQEPSLFPDRHVYNKLNIYYFNSITYNGNGYCGYSYLPPSQDVAMMANNCVTNGTTLIHEIGHYLSLYHTHGKSNCGVITDELVNGSNCNTAGDDVCDTPADPNLLAGDDCEISLTNSDCEYIGTAMDANEDEYNPFINNIMSYSRKDCRNSLTTGQFDRVIFSAIYDRSNLFCDNYCTPSVAGNSSNAYISGIGLRQINNPSGHGQYNDFTQEHGALLTPSDTYTLFMQKPTTPNLSFYWYVWIDYNRNNTFEDSELIISLSDESADMLSQSFTVPADVPNGQTRMRVYLKSFSNQTPVPPAPCDDLNDLGEIEDYRIFIFNGCQGEYNISGSIYPEHYKAEDYIISDGQVQAGDDVIFQAGNVIDLLPGFIADGDLNTTFEAFIAPCTPSSSSSGQPDFDYSNDNKTTTIRNYPNPFTRQTTIEFTLAEDTPVTLSVSDATGRRVALLLNYEVKTQGIHTATFDGNNYSAGMYYYTIQAGEYTSTQKMILIK